MIIKDNESSDIHTSTGPMRTYLFRPVAEGRYPGLVLFSEIFQVTGLSGMSQRCWRATDL
jgi:carboxymethylenebutenolidase